MRPLQRRGGLALAVVLLQASLGMDGTRADGPCSPIRLSIDAAASNFTFSGQNALVPVAGGFPIRATMQQIGSFATAFQGALFTTGSSSSGSISNGTCPTSLEGWAATLHGATLSSRLDPDALQGVSLWPSYINGSTAGQAYQPRNFLVSLTSTSVAADAGSFSIEGTSSLLIGCV